MMTPGRSFTVKTLLAPLLGHPRASQLIKWTVYTALIINFGVYAWDDFHAYKAALPPGAPLDQVLEQFSTTIDMAAWLGLVFMFELETYALPDAAFTKWVIRSLIVLRVICYVSIGFAAYGYTMTTLDYYRVEPVAGVADLCDLADSETALQLDAIAYTDITAENCSTLTNGDRFFRVPDELSILDETVLLHAKRMGWVDILNAYVWLIVVFLIEIEVRMQSADRFGTRSLNLVRQAKTIFYGILILNIFIWLGSSYPLYAWDAFLWIFGFWAIELNLAEWEQERTYQLAGAVPA